MASARRDDRVTYNPDLLDFGGDHIAGPQPFLGIASRADTCGRAGGDDIAGLERDALADVGYEPVDLKEHVTGIAALLLDAVAGKPAIEQIGSASRRDRECQEV